MTAKHESELTAAEAHHRAVTERVAARIAQQFPQYADWTIEMQTLELFEAEMPAAEFSELMYAASSENSVEETCEANIKTCELPTGFSFVRVSKDGRYAMLPIDCRIPGVSEVLPPNAENIKHTCTWTDDCSGKKDFDGRILSFSTRYWPKGGSALTMTRNGLQPFDDGSDASAISELMLWYVDHGGNEDYFRVATSATPDNYYLTGASFEDVSAKVQNWTAETMRRVVRALVAEFGADFLKNRGD